MRKILSNIIWYVNGCFIIFGMVVCLFINIPKLQTYFVRRSLYHFTREKMTKMHKCEICKNPVTIGGDDEEGTHYYIPKFPANDSDKTKCPFCGSLSLVKVVGRKLALVYIDFMEKVSDEWTFADNLGYSFKDGAKEFKQNVIEMRKRIMEHYAITD